MSDLQCETMGHVVREEWKKNAEKFWLRNLNKRLVLDDPKVEGNMILNGYSKR
jgi:hypothetical protein